MSNHTEREREARDRLWLALTTPWPERKSVEFTRIDPIAYYRAAVRAAVLAEVRAKVWPDEHLGSCPASTNLPTDGPDDMMWCDCGYEKFTTLEATDGR